MSDVLKKEQNRDAKIELTEYNKYLLHLQITDIIRLNSFIMIITTISPMIMLMNPGKMMTGTDITIT